MIPMILEEQEVLDGMLYCKEIFIWRLHSAGPVKAISIGGDGN